MLVHVQLLVVCVPATVVIMSIPLFEESGKFSVQLPNAANIAFYFPWFLHAYLCVLAIGRLPLVLACLPLCAGNR